MQQIIATQRISTLEKANSINSTHILNHFIKWCEKQEDKKILWLAIAFVGHIGTVLPLTLFVVINTGNNMMLWMIASMVNVPVLALNLAALPTKVTLPALFFAWFINAVIITYCLVGFFVK